MNTARLARFALAALSFACTTALADVVPGSLFTDHMVLQREKPIAVWGTADAGEKVTVTFAGQSKETIAREDGKWSVTLDALTTSKDGASLVITGKNTVTLSDVLVGEVWLCSGQSNMEWPLTRSRDPEKEIASANYPAIRLFNVSPKKKPSSQPVGKVDAQWQVCTPESVTNFSAVGYFFGRMLQERLDGVPIGLINSSWGGMPAEAFTPLDKMTGDEWAPMHAQWARYIADHPEAVAKWEETRAAWRKQVEEAKLAGKEPPREPARPPGPNSPQRPGNLWNGMIHPLVPYGIRGVIWYQGESNAPRAKQYEKLLPLMITSWRDAFGQGDFPFLVVQLANFVPTQKPEEMGRWAVLRESQRQTALKTKNVGLAVTIDIGEPRDIHPKNKQDVGARLARLALVDTYGIKDLVKQGPTPLDAQFGSRVAMKFADVGTGLKVTGDALTGFEVAGEDGVFKPAEAKLDGEVIYVGSPDVPTPVSVRYCWEDNPTPSLFNSEGLPAGPFVLSK